ncbi:MAG: hypothetical protein AB4911_03030 [Oscillochloridaceae bacterium umkhey_bin13]
MALLGLVLACNLLGLGAILVARAGLPRWIEIAGPTAVALLVPGAMLGAGLIVRHRNPYAARALLWGFLLTVVLGLALTLLFNLLDYVTLTLP